MGILTTIWQVITNTKFQKRQSKLWTYISDMSGTKTKIDYILISNKCNNSVKNVEAFNTFASIESDHRVLAAKLKLSLRTAKKKTRGNVYGWAMLTSDKNLQQLYTVQVKNRYSELNSGSDEDVTNTYQNLIKVND